MIQSLQAPYDHLLIDVETEVEKRLRVNLTDKEPESLAWIETMNSGEVFYDVGANVGNFALIAASRGLQVYAFEPAPFNVKKLKHNAKLNNLSLHIYEWALSDQKGACDFSWSSTEAGAAEHQMIQGHNILVTTIDDFTRLAVHPPDHIKIDVDGSELRVVKGGMNTWPKVQSVQVEIDDSLSGWPETIGLLQDAGLRIEKWTRHGGRSISNVLFRR